MVGIMPNAIYWIEILAEEEALLVYCIPTLSALHILVHLEGRTYQVNHTDQINAGTARNDALRTYDDTNLRNGDVEVQPKTQDGAREKDDEYGERRVFKICDLHFHASELDAPSYGRARRGYFEPQRLPVRRLNVLR
jgi:hypothetical protein